MTFGTNVAISRNIFSNTIHVARIVTVGISILMARPADAGSIETKMDADTPRVSLVEMAPASVRLTALAADTFDHKSPFNSQSEDPLNVLVNLSSVLCTNNNCGSERIVRDGDVGDNVFLVHIYSPAAVDNNLVPPLLTNASVHETFVVLEKNVPCPPAEHRRLPALDDQEEEFSDSESYVDDEMSQDLFASQVHSHYQYDFFDPVTAYVAFVVLGGIALAMNVVSRGTMQTSY